MENSNNCIKQKARSIVKTYFLLSKDREPIHLKTAFKLSTELLGGQISEEVLSIYKEVINEELRARY